MARIMVGLAVLACVVFVAGCEAEVGSNSGLERASVSVPTTPEGYSIEQRNVRNRLLADNEPGSIKHLYVISPYSGQVLLYSTVDGKVTSSHKRLSPSTVGCDGQSGGVPVDGGTWSRRTPEVLGDDGTYGGSAEYIYWWDTRGIYHQHFIGSCEVHISNEPLAVKNIVLNLELQSIGG
jgi:hypothetical protein